jgi:GT2 family glycosyltransferase
MGQGGHNPLAFLARAWRQRRRPEPAIDRAYPAWVRHHRVDTARWQAEIASLKTRPLISVIMPVHETHPAWLTEAIASVRTQLYPNWELMIADDASTSPTVAAILAGLPPDTRIHVTRLPTQGGISAASNLALAHAGGAYVTFLDHDDLLAPHALAAAAREITATPTLDLLFSDEDQWRRCRPARPYFKPGWNPDLLLAQNCIGHMAVYRRTLVTRLGGLRSQMDGSQDHDLALRVAEQTDPTRIRHIPEILYHWRQSPTAYSTAKAENCRAAARSAVSSHLGDAADVTAPQTLPAWAAVRFKLPQPAPTVSIIGVWPAEAGDRGGLRVKEAIDPAQAEGDVLLFLSPTLRPQNPDWLRALVAHLWREGVAAAGARLEGPGGTILHAGYVLDPKHVAQSPAPGSDSADQGYRGHFILARTVSAVSLDCLAVRRDAFLAAGGFSADAADFRAVDLSLKLATRGWRTVWVPQARLRYSRPPKPMRSGAKWMRARWAEALARDAYFSPALQIRNGRIKLR